MIPKNFENKYKLLFEKEYDEIISINRDYIKSAIRVNTIKISKKELTSRIMDKGWKIKQIPWFENGFFVETEEDKSKTPEYLLGYYYIQESISMLPPVILDAKENERVLDLAASPGSKTTQMAAMMNNKGLIVANDIKMKRLVALRFNLQKYGVINTIVTNMDGRQFQNLNIKFDKVLLDAPCSNSGMFFKNPTLFKYWNQSRINEMSRLQKQLLQSASKCLTDDGIIVYSTCSLEPEENEEVIDYAVNCLNLNVEKVNIKGLKYHKGLKSFEKKEYSSEVKKCLRIMPNDNFTEGFFVCKLKKS